MVNLITDRTFTIRPDRRVSLPGLLAAMTRGDVREFPSLRAHQRSAWHMFLVQLAALALWKAGRTDLPRQADVWTEALRGLVPDYPGDAPWRLVAQEPDLPAFLQPPDPGGMRWRPVETPDALDVLNTARNHDIKRAVNRQASSEDWILTMVCLQTMSGYSGNGQHGVARMNGGFASRSLVGLAPARPADLSLNPSAWWARDVERLLEQRAAGEGTAFGTPGGPAALWCLDWPEGEQLAVATLDPWFIEVCRRVRLVEKDGGFVAFTSTSGAARIDAKRHKGDVGDPWAPAHLKEAKCLTVGKDGFDYERLCDLLFSGDWTLPVLARRGEGEQDRDMVLVAEALSRGRGRTDGFKSRVVAMPAERARQLPSSRAAVEGRAQMEEIGVFHRALRYALALAAAGGDREAVDAKHFARTAEAVNRLNDAADRIFFPYLWRRMEDANARPEFLDALWKVTQQEFGTALDEMKCPALKRARAHARADRALAAGVWREFPELFERETEPDRA